MSDTVSIEELLRRKISRNHYFSVPAEIDNKNTDFDKH